MLMISISSIVNTELPKYDDDDNNNKCYIFIPDFERLHNCDN